MRTGKIAGLVFLSLVFCLFGCGNKEKGAGLEGKVVDGLGKPVAGVSVLARMEKPLKGYSEFAAVTDASGTFNFGKMYPQSRYVLTLRSDKWATSASVVAETGPDGETALMIKPFVIAAAYTKAGTLVSDLATGATRFSVSADGVISDSLTGLEWVAGKDFDTTYEAAVAWVADCSIAGGKWRMPSQKELGSLYRKNVGERNMDPAFKIKGWSVWAEPRDSSSAFAFDFLEGKEDWGGLNDSYYRRAFGVRKAVKAG